MHKIQSTENKNCAAKWIWQVGQTSYWKCPLCSKPTLAMTWTLAPLIMAPCTVVGRELSSLALFCVKLLHKESCVCVEFPSVLLSKVCVITVRHMLPKQRLAGPCGGKLLLSNMTTQSNQARISLLFMTPVTHFNLITQLPAFLSSLDLSHYLSPLIPISLVPLLPLSCLLL